MAFESIQRLLSPAAIHYQQAIGVATLGLLVNLACAWLLKDGHHHHHGHEHHSDHHHGHDHAHGDLNLRSAYLHVIADAATSVMAIAALLGGMLLGFAWLDSVMGLVGSVMVAMWASGLLRDSSRVLLDAEMDAPVVQEVREAIAQGPQPVNITDLHVWRVGKNHYACIIAVEGAATVTPDYIRQLLSVHEELTHVSVEVNRTEPA
jgi:cation diffusion facilitator family transporter